MTEYEIRYTIDIGDGLRSTGEYSCDEGEMRKFVAKMREEYGEEIKFRIRKVAE